MTRFSIVTVCFNAEASMAATAASLRQQTETDYEWLVVDGASTDATLQRAHEAGIAQTRIVSEPDRGIYDAMNKAVKLAQGEWVYFLNAGDTLADAQVLADVAALARSQPAARLIFGDMAYVSAAGERVKRFAHIRRSTLVFDDLNHQAVFAQRSLFTEVGPFDLRHKLSADYDWLLRVFASGAVTRYLPRVMARFEVGGAHSKDTAVLGAERRALRLNHVTPAGLWLGGQLARLRRRLRLWRGHGG